MGISIDSKYCHTAWANGFGGIAFPLLADFHPKGEVGRLYGVYLEDKGFNARTTFVIDPEGRISHVQENQIGEVPEIPGEQSVPLVVLTGRHGVTGADPRIVAAVKRPAGLHDLYRVLQEVLEESPRGTPRVPTHIPCMCEMDGRSWRATLLSLSESGGLLRSPEPMTLGGEITLRFSLPRMNHVELTADAIVPVAI